MSQPSTPLTETASSLPSSRQGFRSRHVLLIFAALSLLLTWPLVTRFTTHVPGDGIDDPALAWNLWWVKVRLVDQLNFDIFHCDWLFFPIQINLGFYTLTPLNGLLSIPLQTASSLIVASNLLLLLSFVLGGLGMYLLARQELRVANTHFATLQLCNFAALFAALIYAFASSKLFYASLGQFNIASSQWIPFCVLYIMRLGRSQTRRQAIRNGLMAALFFSFQAWAELTFASFLLIFIGLWVVWAWVGRRGSGEIERQVDREMGSSPLAIRNRLTEDFGELSRVAHERPQSAIRNPQFTGLLAFALLATLGLAPFLWAMLPDLLKQGDFFGSGGGFADLFSADLAGYLLPTRLHPWLGEWIRSLPFQNGKGQQIFIGYSVMLLALTGVVTGIRNSQLALRTSTRFWLTISLLFFLLTLGPYLHWMGENLPIPGPFAVVSQLPFFSGNRYPSRYGVMLMMGVAMLAAFGVRRALEIGDWRLGRFPQSPISNLQSGLPALLVSLFAALFFFEHLSIPLPLSDLRVPAVYQRIAQTPGDFTVLELPTGWRNGAQEIGRRDVLFMLQQWYQTTHGKRRLAGNTSRNPAYKFQYFSEAPLISDLIALMNADQWWMKPEVDKNYVGMVTQAKRQSPHILDFLNVRFITVHVEKSTPQLLQFVEEALPVTLIDTWQGSDWSGAASTIRLYEVRAPDKSLDTIQVDSAQGRLYRGDGWSSFAESGAAIQLQSTLLLDLPDDGGVLTLDLSTRTGEVEFWLNDLRLEFTQTDRVVYRVVVPKGSAGEPVDLLELRFGSEHGLVEKGNEWRIGSTGAASNINLAVRSAGLDVGGFAHIYLWGKDVARNQRGYNLAAISPNGDLLDSVVFDTFANCGSEPPDESASMAMADWLRQWSAGTFIAGAAADEASCRLRQAAVDGLRTIGVSGDLRGRFRWGHAFIGMVGAQAGEAIETVSLLQPAEVRAGRSNDGQYVYGLLDKVQFLPATAAGKSLVAMQKDSADWARRTGDATYEKTHASR